MLRPATPLSILFLVAFVLLLLSTLSTPIIKGIPLATNEGVDYGVFGACKGSQCVGPRIGYNPDVLLSTNDDADFSLPASTRHSLSVILIVHPVAALLTLICFGLAFAAHFHSPAHSPRYLLALLILSFPTLLVALLAFLVDILLFVPHMKWGGWIVLAATILIVASGVVTCAMRRTLVSRKARKKRIQENAEMNGQNYYANQNAPRLAQDDVGLPRADSPPPMSVDPKVPQFASFETRKSSDNGRKSSDDREPLNPRTPSLRSVSTNGTRRPIAGGADAPPMPGYGPNDMRRRPSRDQYGNPLPPDAVAMNAGLPPPGLRHQNSRGSMRSQGSGRSYRSNGSRGPPPGYRGARGGFPGGRGGYPPREGPGMGPRGGYGPPIGAYAGRGGPGYGPRGGMDPIRGGPNGMRGPPPPGWNGPAQAGAAPPGYELDNYYTGGENEQADPSYGQAMPMRAPSETGSYNGIGQAIEMDERHGRPSNSGQQNFGLRDSDGDVAGIVALQQARANSGDRPNRSHNMSPSSIYSGDRNSDQRSYVPPRSHWAAPSPLGAHNHSNSSQTLPDAARISNLSPIAASPTSTVPGHKRTNSENYYEDVDPRFATDENAPPSPVPHSLTPGPQIRYHAPSPHLGEQMPTYMSDPNSNTSMPLTGSDPSLLRAGDSFENIPEGARSPAESDASHFTSISQRGVNPDWRPPPGQHQARAPMMGGGGMQRKNDDVILGANPDFSIPGVRPGRGGRGGGGMGMGRAMVGHSNLDGGRGMPTPGMGGVVPAGRYPEQI